MWKEDEPGATRVNWERSAEAIETGAEVIAMNCPFCTTMFIDGVKKAEKEESVQVLDVSEILLRSMAD